MKGNCKGCGVEITIVEGRRPREFHSDACRNKYHKKTQNLLAGDCPFTGICFDEDFLDNIRKFVKKPDSTTFKELLTDAVYNTINAGCKDWDYINSDEGIEESIIANEYEFKADGTRF